MSFVSGVQIEELTVYNDPKVVLSDTVNGEEAAQH